jgi:hypothetical protein
LNGRLSEGKNQRGFIADKFYDLNIDMAALTVRDLALHLAENPAPA